jgi:hypothetical protein
MEKADMPGKSSGGHSMILSKLKTIVSVFADEFVTSFSIYASSALSM